MEENIYEFGPDPKEKKRIDEARKTGGIIGGAVVAGGIATVGAAKAAEAISDGLDHLDVQAEIMEVEPDVTAEIADSSNVESESVERYETHHHTHSTTHQDLVHQGEELPLVAITEPEPEPIPLDPEPEPIPLDPEPEPIPVEPEPEPIPEPEPEPEPEPGPVDPEPWPAPCIYGGPPPETWDDPSGLVEPDYAGPLGWDEMDDPENLVEDIGPDPMI